MTLVVIYVEPLSNQKIVTVRVVVNHYVVHANSLANVTKCKDDEWMFDRLRAFFMKQKLHDFDLKNPEHYDIGVETYSMFKCKNCEKVLYLEPWQMENLPYDMKVGCQ